MNIGIMLSEFKFNQSGKNWSSWMFECSVPLWYSNILCFLVLGINELQLYYFFYDKIKLIRTCVGLYQKTKRYSLLWITLILKTIS